MIVPVDEKRKRLYNSILARHWPEIEPEFDVLGFKAEASEPYSPEDFYDKFEVSLKF